MARSAKALLAYLLLFRHRIHPMEMLYGTFWSDHSDERAKSWDEESMKDNNTSAFNCRYAKGSNRIFSQHSYGLAIDINPLDNPYIKNGEVSPPQGRKSRNKMSKGMVRKGGS